MLSDNNSAFCSNSFMEVIGDFLDDEGGIIVSSIDKLVNLMNETNDKLVPKCMALTIISLSTTDVQIKLCESGVWNILFQWLQDGLKNDTTCFILEILHLYLTLPITFEILRSNSCPKLIRQLTKNTDPDIIAIAKRIVSKWKKIIEERALQDVSEIPTKKIKLDDNIVKIDKVPEEKTKFRTVKVKNTDFRTAGVEEPETDLQKPVKKIIKKIDDKPGMEEIHQKVIVTVDKRKIIEIHESKNFINSIMQTPAPPRKKKKRQDISIIKSTSDVFVAEDVAVEPATEVTPSQDLEPISDTQSISEKSKKRVSWATSSDLENIKYFELDENEWVNVSRVSIEEMKKKERMIERQHASHKFCLDEIDDDAIVEKWYKPVAVVGVSGNKIEVTSIERTVQFERERKVLKVLYFTNNAVPPSPSEPDIESYDVKDPVPIPLEDITSKKAAMKLPLVNDVNSKLLIYTENDGKECHVTLRPDVANLLKSMTQTPSIMMPIMVPEPPKPSECNSADAVQTRNKLITIIKSRHPDIDPEKLTSEEVCKLLEPMRDQLIREGILSMPQSQQPPPQSNLVVHPQNFMQPNAIPPWFDPRAHFAPRQHPHDLHMMPQRMPYHANMMPQSNRPFPQHPMQPQTRPLMPVCRFFVSNGYCPTINNCVFSHTLPPDAHRPFNQNRH